MESSVEGIKLNKALANLITQVSGSANMLVIPRVYITMCDGHIETALALSQMVYWSDRSKRTDGLFYKTYKEWHLEIGIKERSMRDIVRKLEARGLIETVIKRANSVPTLHIRVKPEAIAQAIIDAVKEQERIEQEPEIEEVEAGSANIADNIPAKNAEPLTETTTETIVIAPEEYFQDATQKVLAPPPNAEEYRKRVVAAINAFESRNAGGNGNIENYLSGIPEYVREIARVYCEHFNRPPIKNEASYWMAGYKAQYEIGLNPEVIKEAISQMIQQRLTIKSPHSVTAIAEDIANRRRNDLKRDGSAYATAAEVWDSEGRIK